MKHMIYNPLKILLAMAMICLLTTSVYLPVAGGASESKATFTVQ